MFQRLIVAWVALGNGKWILFGAMFCELKKHLIKNLQHLSLAQFSWLAETMMRVFTCARNGEVAWVEPSSDEVKNIYLPKMAKPDSIVVHFNVLTKAYISSLDTQCMLVIGKGHVQKHMSLGHSDQSIF